MDKKILIIDDDELVLKSFVKLLKVSGYAVTSAASSPLVFDRGLSNFRAEASDGADLLYGDLYAVNAQQCNSVKDRGVFIGFCSSLFPVDTPPRIPSQLTLV